MFRKDNGFSAKLLMQFNVLYLTTDDTSMTLQNVIPLSRSIERAVEDHCPKKLVLDLRNIERLDSSGFGVIINTYSKCKSKNCDFAVMNVNEKIERLFKITQIEDIIIIIKSIDEFCK